jgi:hypothetical protein
VDRYKTARDNTIFRMTLLGKSWKQNKTKQVNTETNFTAKIKRTLKKIQASIYLPCCKYFTVSTLIAESVIYFFSLDRSCKYIYIYSCYLTLDSYQLAVLAIDTFLQFWSPEGVTGVSLRFMQNVVTIFWLRLRIYPFPQGFANEKTTRSDLTTAKKWFVLKANYRNLHFTFLKIKEKNNILPLVRGSVTNNDGFWIGWLDLLALLLQSLLFTINYRAIAKLLISQITLPYTLLYCSVLPIPIL